VSLLTACIIYSALGAAVMTGSKHIATHGSPIRFGLENVEEVILPAMPPLPPAPAVRGGGARTENVKPLPVPTDTNVVPIVTPTTTVTKDLSTSTLAAGEAGNGPVVPGVIQAPVTVQGTPPPAAVSVVELDFSQVRVLKQVAPIYPGLARLVKAQGPVELRLTIDTEGVPSNVEVVSGPHALLIGEAVRVARLWRFQPATVNGRPVAAAFHLTVSFRLDK
jgi:protein TonB